ncbi:MAG: hypothetical protein ACREEW_13245 [Caulobacteraceae bacterium]
MDELFSRVSFNDLKTKIQLKSEEKMADTLQGYESLVLVVSKALGGGKKRGPPPKTYADLEARLAKALG